MLTLIHSLINDNVWIHSLFYDLARGLSLTRKKDALQWDRGGDDAAAYLPSPLAPSLTYVTNEKGMPFGMMDKKPKGAKFAGRRKVFRRQMCGALSSSPWPRTRNKNPENWAASARRAAHGANRRTLKRRFTEGVEEEERKGERVRERSYLTLPVEVFSAHCLVTGKRRHFSGFLRCVKVERVCGKSGVAVLFSYRN